MKSTPSAKITCLWLDSGEDWSENKKKKMTLWIINILVTFQLNFISSQLLTVERPNINPNARNNFWITGVRIIEK